MYALIFSYVGRMAVKDAFHSSAAMLLAMPLMLMVFAVPLLVLSVPALVFAFIFHDSEIRQYVRYIFHIPYIGFLILSLLRAKDGLDDLFPEP